MNRLDQTAGFFSPGASLRGDLPTLLLKTRIKSEVERSKLLEIKAKVEAGKYVDADEVRIAAFNKGRTVRDNLLNYGDSLLNSRAHFTSRARTGLELSKLSP